MKGREALQQGYEAAQPNQDGQRELITCFSVWSAIGISTIEIWQFRKIDCALRHLGQHAGAIPVVSPALVTKSCVTRRFEGLAREDG
jgi:hypothetical protein